MSAGLGVLERSVHGELSGQGEAEASEQGNFHWGGYGRWDVWVWLVGVTM